MALLNSDRNSRQSRGTIPRRVVDGLVALLPNSEIAVDLGLSDRSARFQWPSVTITAPLFAANFPNVMEVIPEMCEFETRLATARFRGVVGAVAPIATDRHHTVEMTTSGKKLRIRSDSPEIGFAEDVINLEQDGREFAIAFNAEHLMRFLEAVDSSEVMFGVKWNDRNGLQIAGCLLRPAERNDYGYYVAPIVRDEMERVNAQTS